MHQQEPLQVQINSIIALFSSGQVQEALNVVETLIKDYPNEPVLYNISGACYANLGQLDDAVKRYEKSLAIKPNYAEAHNNLGGTLQELGQLDNAVKRYEKALAIKPNYAEAFNNLGIALKELGQLDIAVKSYKKILTIRPDFAEAHYNLAVTLQELGQLDIAVKSYKKALALKLDFADAHYNLGLTFKELGQHDDAVKSYEKVLAIKPDYTEAHNNLGIALKELGQLDDAIKCYKKALAIKPDYTEAHNNLGNALKELGQLDDAIKCYKKALAIKEDYAEAHYNLGLTFQGLSQLDDAVKSYKKALAIKEDYAEAHNNLGIALKELGQLDDAVKSYKKALAIKEDFADAYNNLGNALNDLGQLDHAIKNYEKAIAIKTNYTSAHLNLSRLKKYIANDTQITQMQSLISNSNLSKLDYIYLNFALAKVYEDLGNTDKLFKYLHEGNRLRKQELHYSLKEDKDNYLIFKKLFNSPKPIDKKYFSSESSTNRPIFIVGMPRSGTSLVEQIIASHYAVHGAGELNNLATIIEPITTDHLNQGMSKLPKKTFLSIREQYLDALSNLNVTESVITDKLPLNFLYIGFILTSFPEAKIVHMKRDARATCWSIYKHFFGDIGNGYSYNIEDLVGFYDLYSELMDFWHQSFPGKIYDMCYEDLTTNQEEETRNLLQYCALDWDDNCLSFHKNKRAVKTASANQVREKMYQGSSEAWKKYEAHLKPLIKALDSY